MTVSFKDKKRHGWLTLLMVSALVTGFASQSRDVISQDSALNGAIDLHVHELPDSENWRIDAIDIAKLARDRGMRGLVLKSHWHSTAEMAYLVRKVVPGIEVFGGIGLSRATGGVN